MATSSITKNFVVHDMATYEKFRKDIEREVQPQKPVEESPAMKKGRERLATVVFR